MCRNIRPLHNFEPPASTRYSEGLISSSPALITSPVPVLVCIATQPSAAAAATGYGPVKRLF